MSVVIPVWNEDPKTLRVLYDRLQQALGGSVGLWEVVFVDDASGAITRQALDELAAGDPRQVRLLWQAQRRGQEAALIAGFLAARGEFVCAMDCDLEHCPEEIPPMVERLRQGDDVVLGRRRPSRRNPWRRLISRVYTAAMNLRWGMRLGDWGCGFNAARRSAVEAVRWQLPGQAAGPLKQLLIRHARRWSEFDVTLDPRQSGRSGYRGAHFLRHGLRMLVCGRSSAAHPLFASSFGSTPRCDDGAEFGASRVLLEEDDDVTGGTPWAAAGYTVAPFLTPEMYARLRAGIRALIVAHLQQMGLRIDGGAPLDQYHRLIRHDDMAHERLVRRLNRLPLRALPIGSSDIIERVSAICRAPLTMRNPHFGIIAPWASVFGIRIVRPRSSDHNPLHRDAWLRRLRDAVNLYVPIAGSDERSSLGLVPGSHRWSEADIERTRSGAVIDGRRYTVPAVTGVRKPLTLIRPNPRDDEVLVFSPYLIHGGAANLNPDATRVSLELRLWRRPFDSRYRTRREAKRSRGGLRSGFRSTDGQEGARRSTSLRVASRAQSRDATGSTRGVPR